MSARARRKIYELSTNAALGRGRKNLMAALGALLLIFNIFGAVALGARADARAPMLSDLSGDRIVICTGAGMIVIDRDGKPVNQPSGQAQQLCPFCLPLTHGGAAPPAAVALNFCGVVARAESPAVVALALPAPRLWRPSAPRGPPRA